MSEIDEKKLKQLTNRRHLEFYDKTLGILEFILAECARDIKSAEFEFIDMPKNTVSVLDFLISAAGKIQKGQRLALGLDEESPADEPPKINIIEGLRKDRI